METEESEKKLMNCCDNKGKLCFRDKGPVKIIDGKVSIITPTYNCAAYIGETIEAVLNQTYQNWEMIIIDDQSEDNTSVTVRKYADNDNRIIYRRLKENSGAAIARTAAMKLATGQYMAFLDSDDIWLPEKLEKQLRFMKEKY